MQTQKRGLTLIDVLLAAGIICVLAVAFYPTWAKDHYGSIADKVMSKSDRQKIVSVIQGGRCASIKVGELTFWAARYSPHQSGFGATYSLWVEKDIREIVARTNTTTAEISRLDVDVLIRRLVRHYDGDTKLLRRNLGYDKKEAEPASKAQASESPPKP